MNKKSYLPLTFSIDNNYQSDKFIKLRMRLCHDGVNPNNSKFKLEDMLARKDSLAESPILAHVYLNEDGIPELGEHDFIIEENKLRPEEDKIVYLEQPVGVIPKDYNLEVVEQDGRNYLMVDGYIWKGYSNYCEDIIQDGDDFHISMEIDIYNYTYDANEDCYAINDFIFKGVTILNSVYETGMKNARAKVANFAANKDDSESIFNQMKEALRKEFSLNNTEKGERTMDIEKILSEMSLTREELTFDITEDMSEEDFRAKCQEYIDSKTTSDNEGDTEPTAGDTTDTSSEDFSADSNDATDDTSTDAADNSTDTSDEPVAEKFTIELSVDQKMERIYKLYNLNEIDIFIADLYDNYFIYYLYNDGKTFKQNYNVDSNGEVNLDGEAIEVFATYLTSEEQAELDEIKNGYATMSQDYAELKEYKKNSEAAARENSLNEIFTKFESELGEVDEFKNLKSDNEKYSVSDVEEKCYALLGRKNSTFSFNGNKSIRMGVDKPDDNSHENPYGDLFETYLDN